MGWFTKKKEATLEIGDLYVYLPDLLERKRKHLDVLQKLQTELFKKESSTKEVLKHVASVLQKANQSLIHNKRTLTKLEADKTLAEGKSALESFNRQMESVEQESLNFFKTSQLFEKINGMLTEKTAEMKQVKDPLQRAINRMEVEVEESDALILNVTAKELDYFKRVNRIERFQQLVPVFDKRKSEDDKIIEALNSLLSFSSSKDEIDRQLSLYALTEEQMKEFKSKHV